MTEQAIAEHRRSVIAAVLEGHDVPEHVLVEYADVYNFTEARQRLLAEIGLDTNPDPVRLDQTEPEPPASTETDVSPTVDTLLKHGLRAGLVISDEIRQRVREAVKKNASADAQAPQP